MQKRKKGPMATVRATRVFAKYGMEGIYWLDLKGDIELFDRQVDTTDLCMVFDADPATDYIVVGESRLSINGYIDSPRYRVQFPAAHHVGSMPLTRRVKEHQERVGAVMRQNPGAIVQRRVVLVYPSHDVALVTVLSIKNKKRKTSR